jgi:ribosomal protein L29
MVLAELKQRSDKELTELVGTLRERVRVLRFDAASDAVKNVREFRDAKRTIARALTLLAQRKAKTAVTK